MINILISENKQVSTTCLVLTYSCKNKSPKIHDDQFIAAVFRTLFSRLFLHVSRHTNTNIPVTKM